MPLVVFAILVYLCTVNVHGSGSPADMCPVSLTRSNAHANFFYPLNIYAPHMLVTSKKYSFGCPDYWNGSVNGNVCSNDTFCPLHSKANRIASSANHRKSASLCHFKPILEKGKSRVRLIVSGGSLTAGVHSTGCSKGTNTSNGYDNRRCSWFHHFSEWAKSYYTNITTHLLLDYHFKDDYSLLRQRRLADLMALEGISSFTTNDIVFLDHSVEDDGDIVRAEDAVKLLIRRIYLQSDKNSLPSIVILDSSPVTIVGKSPLTSLYRKVARDQNIALWSFRDVVLSKSALATSSYNFNFVNGTKGFVLPSKQYPPWHVHLFIADLYASIFQTELKHCTDDIVAKTTGLHHNPVPLPPLTGKLMECENNANLLFQYIKKGPNNGVTKATNANPAYRIVKLRDKFTRWPAGFEWFSDDYGPCGTDKSALDAYNTIRVDGLTSKWNWKSDEDVNRELDKVYNDNSIRCPVFKREAFLSLLRNKKLAIFGDSLSGQMFEGILNHLRIDDRHTIYGMHQKKKTRPKAFYGVSLIHYHDYNATFYRLDTVRLNLTMHAKFLDGSNDVIIIAVGAWFKPQFRLYARGPYNVSYELSRKQLSESLRVGRKVIRKLNPRTKVLWRLHPHVGSMDALVLEPNRTGCLNHWDGMYWSQPGLGSFWVHGYNEIIRTVAKENGDPIIDWYSMSLLYMDYFTHRGHPTHVDAIHYCGTSLPKGAALLVQDALYDLFGTVKGK